MKLAINDQSLMARVVRSTSWIILGFGTGQILRLGSNLLLTRILFPEAFGLMALVTVIIIGLSLFSDMGISNAIAQNPRGDEPDFLDSAWTVQIIRGGLLWLLTCALALPAAAFYNAPELTYCLPLAGFSLVIQGLQPTRVETAYRHLLVGRVTAINLMAQVCGIVSMVTLAIWTQSVIALAIGSVLQEAAKLALAHWALPGRRNALRWEPAATHELIGMGKWIFLSTACFFLTTQGDRAILGKYLSLEAMGIYNIAFFLANFPVQLGQDVNQRLMIPVYRDKPALHSDENRRKQRQLRYALTGGILSILWLMAWIGPWLVDLLYDHRYASAGPVIVLLASSLAPSIIVLTYDRASLAAGNTKGFFFYTATRAFVQTALFLAGVANFGLVGGIAAMGLAVFLSYPTLMRQTRPYRAEDPRHDLVFLAASALLCGGALWYHWPKISSSLGLM
ncbi:oligosaccharide flippase family protein [Tritonibacter mobilis]|uniref:oligosaccharide flippase family protein n=1 Tax=Tritonibacter mobilis TaxID=379347 RepID=UPI001C08F793|nr:oligosaccharide flippase family protein [Tritonibacter mobilis]MBU3032652.1 oligosaccharide flippase family protein [Tritonibacter mobilis]WHQ81851.1 oligosaccharide flippase family protein [Tritonibacter mobilis]